MNTVKKPTPSQVIKRYTYWNEVIPSNLYPKPEWVFDYVSVHMDYTGKYSLLSPMCLVEQNGKRPEFEKEKFDKKTGAISRAKEIAKSNKLFVVDCSQ